MGFGRLTLFNATHLHYSQVSVFSCPLIDAVSYDDPCGQNWPGVNNARKNSFKPKVIDHFWIVKKET